jgi:hypothetical protein
MPQFYRPRNYFGDLYTGEDCGNIRKRPLSSRGTCRSRSVLVFQTAVDLSDSTSTAHVILSNSSLASLFNKWRDTRVLGSCSLGFFGWLGQHKADIAFAVVVARTAVHRLRCPDTGIALCLIFSYGSGFSNKDISST